MALSKDARLLRMYRARPDLWVKHKIDIELARYRRANELDEFLAAHPHHEWAGRHRQKLTLDPDRSYQEEGLRMIAKPGRYIFRWPNAVGKTAMEALIVLWFLDCYPDGVVATTAGTWFQIKDQLWREIPFWLERAKDEVVVKNPTATGIDIDSKWYAAGRAASKEATFEGIHSRRVLMLFDEGKAIGKPIYDAARRILRGTPEAWWIVGSTPGSPVGSYYEACQTSLWKQHHFTAYESSMISLDQLEDDWLELGERSPLFWSMVLAEFPEEAEDTVLPLSEVQSIVDDTAAQARCLEYGFEPRAGIDVARFGNDETAICLALGGWCKEMHAWRGRRLTETAGRCLEHLRRWGVQPGCTGVDDVGLGGGVTDMLYEQELDPVPISNSMRAAQEARFADWITEAWFSYRDMVRDGLASIPDDKILINQLAGRRYEITADSRLRIESKNRLRQRALRSPDRAEALMYATGMLSLAGASPAEEIYSPASMETMGEF